VSCLTGAGGERQYFVGAGLGSATTIVVGNYLGEGRAASARTVSQVAFCAGLVLMAVMVGAAYALREPGFALLTRDAALRDAMRAIYPYSALFCFLDGSVMIVLTGA